MKSITYAPDAWKYLNGIFCVYKPPNTTVGFVRRTLAFNLCRDLNEMEKRPARDLVLLKGSVSEGQPFSVEVSTNYADHELVTGARYQKHDVRLATIDMIGVRTSGVFLLAVNDGCKQVKSFGSGTFLRKYEINCKFGLATRNFMSDGKVVERTSYSHVRQGALEKLLASIQFTYQALSYRYSGIDSQSQAAYELASKGLVRPIGKTKPLIYGMKCTKLDLPEFTLEIHCINETEEFLAELVHQIGIYLKSTAVCTSLRRTQFGHFNIDFALLRKHWTLENILTNITLCKQILNRDQYTPSSPQFEVIKPSNLKEVLEDAQNKTRKDVI